MIYPTFWGKVFLLMLMPGKLYDVKFWLMLCSTYGCQLWVITSVFRQHWLCLYTWRVVSGTCASTAGPLTCHVLSPQLSHRLTTRSLFSCIYETGVAQVFEVAGAPSPISGIVFPPSQFWVYPKLDFREVTNRLQRWCMHWLTYFRRSSRWALTSCIFVLDSLC